MLGWMKCGKVKSFLDESRPGSQRGYTLVEQLVVLGIIALLIGIAIPNLRRAMTRADLMDEVKMARQALGVARINAIKSSRRVAVLLLPQDSGEHFDETIVAWVDETLDEALNPGDEVVGRWPLGPSTAIGPEPLNSNWELHDLASPTKGIVFLPNGSAIVHLDQVGVGEGGFVLSDKHGNRILLLVRASGTVEEQMWDPYSSAWSTELKFWMY
ncbi:MAG: prepilin-type N-terminal cleavage/methylation domain-containing protein [Holophagae bacterium]|jgi:prepilin-type N-terminal cleavage/methylation domain-containing protein